MRVAAHRMLYAADRPICGPRGFELGTDGLLGKLYTYVSYQYRLLSASDAGFGISSCAIMLCLSLDLCVRSSPWRHEACLCCHNSLECPHYHIPITGLGRSPSATLRRMRVFFYFERYRINSKRLEFRMIEARELLFWAQ